MHTIKEKIMVRSNFLFNNLKMFFGCSILALVLALATVINPGTAFA
jgi:hypothetical protein